MNRPEKKYKSIFVFVGRRKREKGMDTILIKRGDSLDDIKTRYIVSPTFSPRRYKRNAADEAALYVNNHVCQVCNKSVMSLTHATDGGRGTCAVCMQR